MKGTNQEGLQKLVLPERPKESLIDKRVGPLLKQAQALAVITSEDHMTVAGTIIPRLDEAMKWIDAVATPFVQGLDRMHKQAVLWRKSKLDKLAAEKRRLLDLRLEWTEKENARRAKAAEKLAAGLQKQEQRELERQAKYEEKHGNAEAADILRTHAAQIPLPAVPVEAVAERPGFYVRERWVFDIVAPDLVPREYCSPDAVKIRKVVEAMGPANNIPGITVRKEVKQHSRAVNQ
jgi:hypothetical protein